MIAPVVSLFPVRARPTAGEVDGVEAETLPLEARDELAGDLVRSCNRTRTLAAWLLHREHVDDGIADEELIAVALCADGVRQQPHYARPRVRVRLPLAFVFLDHFECSDALAGPE